MRKKMKDTLHIRNARFLANIGVPQEERSEEQELLFDIRIPFDAAHCDEDIEKTIDYSLIGKIIRRLLEKEHILLETVAHNVACTLKKELNLKEVTIIAKKPQVLSYADYPAIEVTR